MNIISKQILSVFVLLISASTICAEDLNAICKEAESASPDCPNLWLSPGLASYHFNRNVRYRELNWGIGFQSNISEDLSVLAGNYINSEYARSNYAGLTWQPLTWHSAKLGLVGGVFDGYPTMHNNGLFFAILPWISIHNEWIGVNLSLVPNLFNRVHGSINAQVIMRVW